MATPFWECGKFWNKLTIFVFALLWQMGALFLCFLRWGIDWSHFYPKTSIWPLFATPIKERVKFWRKSTTFCICTIMANRCSIPMFFKMGNRLKPFVLPQNLYFTPFFPRHLRSVWNFDVKVQHFVFALLWQMGALFLCFLRWGIHWRHLFTPKPLFDPLLQHPLSSVKNFEVEL